MRNDKKRLLDIIESVENIERYAVKGKEDFFCSRSHAPRHMQIAGWVSDSVTVKLQGFM